MGFDRSYMMCRAMSARAVGGICTYMKESLVIKVSIGPSA